ncbi:hypothetical protein [uncultured Methanolobus sp.]|uniref:hypothetical protein n=1 Tax=uncultured Methanolobus sp. TaxID=218300 RepID=UPI0029C73B6E|nr:hypothetical protein [uncultured Methanolobus sp.]
MSNRNNLFLQFSKMFYSFLFSQKEENPYADIDEWNISPSELCAGEILNIEGKTIPEENIGMNVSFSVSSPVVNGIYKYTFDNVRIPGGSNSFRVRSQKVDDLNFIVRMFVDFKRSFDAENGVAEFFEKNIPAGNYEIIIEGNALDGEKEVKLDFIASQTIRADEKGNFNYQYHTGSLPDGDFIVMIGDNEKTIKLMPSPRDNNE